MFPPLGSLRRGNDVIMAKYLVSHLAFSLDNKEKFFGFQGHILQSVPVCFQSSMTFSYTARASKEFTRAH